MCHAHLVFIFNTILLFIQSVRLIHSEKTAERGVAVKTMFNAMSSLVPVLKVHVLLGGPGEIAIQVHVHKAQRTCPRFYFTVTV